MTAVFVPERPSRFTRGADPGAAAAPPRARRAAAFRDGGAPPPVDVPDGPDATSTATVASVEGYVLFLLGSTTFAVSVGEVREIVRAVRLELLPDSRPAYGHAVALVDVRGRSIPVVDLRTDHDRAGDVLLPMWRHQVGLVVDRVMAVQTPRELVHEHDEVPAALPSYARGVLRPASGGDPVLLIAMPDAAELGSDVERADGTRLGDDVLGHLGLDEVAEADVDAAR